MIVFALGSKDSSNAKLIIVRLSSLLKLSALIVCLASFSQSLINPSVYFAHEATHDLSSSHILSRTFNVLYYDQSQQNAEFRVTSQQGINPDYTFGLPHSERIENVQMYKYGQRSTCAILSLSISNADSIT